MAGILDPKERVLDTIITPTGRSQIATGELKIEYASFSDRQMYYTIKSNGEITDPGSRLSFEAYATDSDVVIQEISDNVSLAPFKTDSFVLRDGNIISGSIQQRNIRAFGDALAIDSIDSLNRQMLIGTRNLLKNVLNENFAITPTDATFYLDQIDTTSSTTIATASLDDVESLWQDYRVTNTPNYKFLPPQAGGTDMGTFTKINQDPPTSFSAILSNLAGLQSQKFTFSNTRTTNDILGQVFEISNDKLTKLVIIDGGTFEVDNIANPHVFYAGKLYRDSQQVLTFVNIFTLVFR